MTSCRSHVDGCWFSSDLFGVRVSVNEGVGAGSRSPPPIINVNYHAHISPALNTRSPSLCALCVTHDFFSNTSELDYRKNTE